MNHSHGINNRRSLRLQNYDYSQAGFYFITICCHGNVCRFGCIGNDEMVLNDYGIIARQEWIALPARFPTVQLDLFQIMPNHMHGIVVLSSTGSPGAITQNQPVGVGQGQALPLRDAHIHTGGLPDANSSPVGAPLAGARSEVIFTPTIGDVVGAYKSLVANKCLMVSKSKNNWLGRFWQRNFYEHVIRDEESYLKIADYIETNPQRWAEDEYHV